MAKEDSERIKKSIYSFTVYKTEKREVEENSKDDDGNEIIIKKTKEEKIPYTVVLLKPTRRQDEEANIEHSIEMGKCISKGMMTRAMMRNKYSDEGGVMSEKDTLRLQQLQVQNREKSIDFLALESIEKRTAAQEKRYKKLEGEIDGIRREMIDIEMSLTNLYAHTADVHAQNKIIIWYMLNLAHYYEEVDDDEIELLPLFEGETFDEKRDSYYALEDKGDNDIFNQVKLTLPAITSLWYLSEANPEEKDYEKLISDIEKEGL